MTNLDEEQDALRSGLRELARLAEGACAGDGQHRPMDSVWVMRTSEPNEPVHMLYTPVLCVIAQGSKQVFLGDDRFVYDPGRFLLNSVTLPASGQVLVASPERPCLSMVVELDAALIASVIVEAGLPPVRSAAPLRALASSPMDGALLESIVRLARLFESPQDAPFLAPLAMREIIYRLLQGDQAARLHQIASHGGQAHRVMRAVDWLRQNFDKPLSMEKLARDSGMSLSALHHHFKDVTAMSPLQFQKQMRLQEAKRLMISQGMDAAGAGVRVGYDDPSYFSRDFRRFFGDPPRRHIERMRGEVA
jgi:AraC-like DNA-binding protein